MTYKQVRGLVGLGLFAACLSVTASKSVDANALTMPRVSTSTTSSAARVAQSSTWIGPTAITSAADEAGYGAVVSSGRGSLTVAYDSGDSSNGSTWLYRVHKAGLGWSTARLMTGSGTPPYFDSPALANDGALIHEVLTQGFDPETLSYQEDNGRTVSLSDRSRRQLFQPSDRS